MELFYWSPPRRWNAFLRFSLIVSRQKIQAYRENYTTMKIKNAPWYSTECDKPLERKFHRWCGWCRICCWLDCQDRCPGQLKSRRYPAACPCRRQSPWPAMINEFIILIARSTTPFLLFLHVFLLFLFVFRLVFSIFAAICERIQRTRTL